MKLLCLSNGHGEDAIALRILQAIQQQDPSLTVAALPIVGIGQPYRDHNIPIVGPTQSMPSGGFVYMDGRQLVRDVRGGLLGLTWGQIKTVKAWAKDQGMILAVGDIVPLLFAWISGATYGFVGTAKSEYYLRDEAGLLPRKSWWERLESWSGSVYLPWERWLMMRSRCRAVFPRDTLTSRVLEQWRIPVFDLGNPMMDGLTPQAKPFQALHPSATEENPPLTFTLMPGSRIPEAYENWSRIVATLKDLLVTFRQRPLLFLGAIAPWLEIDPLRRSLESQGWLMQRRDPHPSFTQRSATLILTQSDFATCLHQGDIAIAMTGTGTEQFVGLGKPAIALSGKGPQFTPAFAEAQTRLLGPSLILAKQPAEVTNIVQSLLQDPDRLQLIHENGYRRMGSSGAAQRIAECLLTQFYIQKS